MNSLVNKFIYMVPTRTILLFRFDIYTVNIVDDHKLLVELAASTTLSPAYSPILFDGIFKDTMKPTSDGRRRSIVFLVCGGFKISLAEMESYRVHLQHRSGSSGVTQINGRVVPLS